MNFVIDSDGLVVDGLDTRSHRLLFEIELNNRYLRVTRMRDNNYTRILQRKAEDLINLNGAILLTQDELDKTDGIDLPNRETLERIAAWAHAMMLAGKTLDTYAPTVGAHFPTFANLLTHVLKDSPAKGIPEPLGMAYDKNRKSVEFEVDAEKTGFLSPEGTVHLLFESAKTKVFGTLIIPDGLDTSTDEVLIRVYFKQ